MPSVVDFEAVPVQCMIIVVVCYFPTLPLLFLRFHQCFVGDMADTDDNDYPNQLWCLLLACRGMICCDCCHKWFHGECFAFQLHREMSCTETMRSMCVTYAFNLPMISLLSGLFQIIPCLFSVGLLLPGPEFCDTICCIL